MHMGFRRPSAAPTTTFRSSHISKRLGTRLATVNSGTMMREMPRMAAAPLPPRKPKKTGQLWPMTTDGVVGEYHPVVRTYQPGDADRQHSLGRVGEQHQHSRAESQDVIGVESADVTAARLADVHALDEAHHRGTRLALTQAGRRRRLTPP